MPGRLVRFKKPEYVRRKHRYVTVSWAFHQLREMVTYKSQLAKAMTIAVDPRHTSQACPVCGHTAKGNRDKQGHRFRCLACAYESNDDRIGAMNLCQKGRMNEIRASAPKKV